MKYTAFVSAALVASATAFAPLSNNGRVSTAIEAVKNKKASASNKDVPLANRIFDLDLFSPKADQNNYGARSKKNLKVGKITSKSYVPSGLSATQYEKIRQAEVAKKEANYQRNVKKAGKFQDFTDWYKKRGTSENFSWMSPTNGHTMVKTKYDWSGLKDTKLWAKEEKADPKKKNRFF